GALDSLPRRLRCLPLHAHLLQPLLQVADVGDDLLLGLPARLQLRALLLQVGEFLLQPRQPLPPAPPPRRPPPPQGGGFPPPPPPAARAPPPPSPCAAPRARSPAAGCGAR